MHSEHLSDATYTIKLSEDTNYIEIKVTGGITREIALEYTIESHKLAEKSGVKKFLVNLLEAVNVESVGNNYDFAYTDLQATKEINKTARVAMLVEENDHSHDFIETLAINAGQNVKLFRNHADALAFLNPE